MDRLYGRCCGIGILFCLFASPLGSTIIVVIRKDNSVVVATDSRRTNPAGQIVSDSVCKIKSLGNNRFLVSAGATRSLEAIDPIKVSQNLSAIEEIAEAIERRLLPLLRVMGSDALQHANESVKNRQYLAGGSLLAFVVVGMTNRNHVGWSMRDYTAWSALSSNYGGRDDVIRNTCPGACPSPEIILSGSTSEAARRAPGLWAQKPPIEIAEELVNIQMRADPANVGGRVSVLKVDDRGHQWIRPGACPND